MKYNTNTTVLCGYLAPNSTVKIKLINTAKDTLVSVSDNECVESENQDGLYFFNTSKIDEVFDALEIAYIMTDDEDGFYGGKVVISNEVPTTSSIRTDIQDATIGNWRIENNQMILDKVDGTELTRFNLFDPAGNPSMRVIYSRERVV